MIRKFAKAVVTASVAATALAGVATPAYAVNKCNGVYEIDGCEYCAYNGGYYGWSHFYCEDGGYSGYSWAGCGIWVSGYCIAGSFDQVRR